jgi:phospholipid/cholesterol/gamma-HCH transport system substrate-binding protein
VDSLNMAVGEFYTVVQKMNSTEGTMGRLINDPALYDNLSQTSSNANALVLDIKDHPKRYINVSIFGRKEK